MIEIGYVGSNWCADNCDLTSFTNLGIYRKTISSYVATYSRIGMISNQASVYNFSSPIKAREAQFPPICLFALFPLFRYEDNYGDYRWRKNVKQAAGIWQLVLVHTTTVLIVFDRLFRFHVHTSSMFANFHIRGWLWHVFKIGSEGKESSGSLPELSTSLDSISIFARMRFAKRCTNRNNARPQSEKTSMNVEAFVQSSMLRPIMSSNAPRWAILVRSVSTI